jgi:putative nucleotidyltransferase with HDIG domain
MQTFEQRGDKKVTVVDKDDNVARLTGLPPLPALLMEALQYTANNQNLSNLADKISQDPPMAVRVLRIANSPFYGMSREIGSLQEAVVVLGINQVRNLLLGIGFLNALPIRHQDFDYPLFWHHGMAVADCARQLAAYTGIDQDIAFTAGLLHDIGLLVIVLLFPDDFSHIVTAPHPTRVEAECQVMGIDHAEIGSLAARFWNLPAAIQEAIQQHETPPLQGAAISLGMLIYTANLLITDAKQDGNATPEHQEAIAQALGMLNIPMDLATDRANISRQFADQIVAIL